MRVLVVEDDHRLGEIIQRGLIEASMAVDWVKNADQARDAAKSSDYDVITLDVLLGGSDTGFAVCKSLRDHRIATPVLMLTALEDVDDRVRGLHSGADDYLVKPFALRELVARIEALSRRHLAQRRAVLRFGSLELDTSARQVSFDGLLVELSTKETSILEHLMLHPRQVLSRQQLEDNVWGYDIPTSNLVEVYIARIRQRLVAAGCGDPIVTVRGVGYRFDPPTQ
jgi:DNA-binding response OmpR family regulator